MKETNQSGMGHKNFMEVINKLPHSQYRMPYTYHHDYIVRHTVNYRSKSRSEVADDLRDVITDETLYATALISLLDDMGSKAFDYLICSDMDVCKKAREVVKDYLEEVDLVDPYLSLPLPKEGDIIQVYHPYYVLVYVQYMSRKAKYYLECEYQEKEVSVRVGKQFIDEKWVPRWEVVM